MLDRIEIAPNDIIRVKPRQESETWKNHTLAIRCKKSSQTDLKPILE